MPKATAKEIRLILASLMDMPDAINHWMHTVDEANWYHAPTGEWNAMQIMGHLQACADLWTHDIFAMLVADAPTLPKIHPNDWMTRVEVLPIHDQMTAFQLQRMRLLPILQKLTIVEWERYGVFAGKQHTVFEQARRMARHEVEHLPQLKNLLLINE